MFVKVRVFPNAKENNIVEKDRDSFDIYVKEKPEKGKANRAVINILALHLKITAGRLKLVKGGNQKSKIFEIIDGRSIK